MRELFYSDSSALQMDPDEMFGIPKGMRRGKVRDINRI